MSAMQQRASTLGDQKRIQGFGKTKQLSQVTIEAIQSTGDPLLSSRSPKPQTSARPLARFFRRRSSSQPGRRRDFNASVTSEIVYVQSTDGPDPFRNDAHLSSPSVSDLAVPRPASRRASVGNEPIEPILAPALSAGIKPFARQLSADSLTSTGTTSPRPSILSAASARTSDTSQQSTGTQARGVQSSIDCGPPSPSLPRRSTRGMSASEVRPSRPGPTPILGESRSSSATATRPMRATRTSSRISFSSITQTLGATAPRPPPDPQTAARLRTMPRLLSYSTSPSSSSTQVPTTSTPATRNARPNLPSPPYQTAEIYASRTSPPLPSVPLPSLPVLTQPAEAGEAASAEASETEPEVESEDDAYDNPDLAAEAGPDNDDEDEDDDVELPRTTPRPSRMRMEMPQRTTPDRLVVTPLTTPRSLAPASPPVRVTPRMPGWTTFATTPGLTPFTARPNSMGHMASYFDALPLHDEPRSLSPGSTTSPEMVTAAASPELASSPSRPALNSRRSRSMVDLAESVRGATVPVPKAVNVTAGRRSLSPERDRRRSMFEMREPPPQYFANPLDAAPVPGWVRQRDALLVAPREDEGRERLPQYTCDVHIEGYVPRKMEFTAPGIQAGNRAWRKQYVVLHGTCIKIYKADPSVYPVPDEAKAESAARRLSVSSTTSYSASATSCEASEDEAPSTRPAPLHVHEGRYGEVEGENNEGFAASILASHLLPGAAGHNACLRNYSLQSAESGLAADYLKRKHVVRVRAEGEQFLIQAKDDRGCIDWIEALQAATNIALDLDARPLPKFITLPRRRRRRRRPDDAANAEGVTSTGTGAHEIPTPRETRMHDMLAEEQDAYLRGP